MWYYLEDNRQKGDKWQGHFILSNKHKSCVIYVPNNIARPHPTYTRQVISGTFTNSTHWDLATPYNVLCIDKHWFSQWLVAWAASKPYMNQCWLIADFFFQQIQGIKNQYIFHENALECHRQIVANLVWPQYVNCVLRFHYIYGPNEPQWEHIIKGYKGSAKCKDLHQVTCFTGGEGLE